jgi:hypothetical protein
MPAAAATCCQHLLALPAGNMTISTPDALTGLDLTDAAATGVWGAWDEPPPPLWRMAMWLLQAG